MNPSYSLTHPDDLIANRRGQISERQRRAASGLALGGGCVLFLVVPFLVIMIGPPLWLAWIEDRQPWAAAALAALALLGVAPLAAYLALVIIRALRVRQDLAAGQVEQAEGTVRWRGNRYAADVPGRPIWSGSTVTGLAPGPYRFYYLPRSGRLLSAEALPGLAPAGELAPLVQVLGQVLGFGPADLEANRAGQLGAGQRARLLLIALLSTLLAVPLLGVVGLIGWLIFSGGGVESTFGLALIVLIGLFGPGLLGWRAVNLARDALGGRVETVTGEGQQSMRRAGRSTTFYYHVGEQRFTVSSSAFRALMAGRRYRGYYTPHSRRLVGLELA
jgi:hypothetical protein